MRSDDILDRLFSLSREAGSGAAKLEAGFEARMMVRIRVRRTPLFWGAWSWRLAPSFMAVVVALGVLYYVTPQQAPLGDLRVAITAEYDNFITQNLLGGE